MTLKEKLLAEPWLPAGLPFLLKQDWADDKFLKERLDEALAQIKKLPKDGSLGAMTKEERTFLKRWSKT